MQSAICLLRGSFPNVAQGCWNILVPDHPRYRFDLCNQLVEIVDGDIGVNELRFPLNPGAQDIAAVIDKVKSSDADCILLGFRGSVHAGQIELAKKLSRELCARGHQLYCIEADVPSGLVQTAELKNVMATLDPSDAAMAALAVVLLSKQRVL
jgi:hypothetical protein